MRGVASHSAALTEQTAFASEFRILPAGEFKAIDGRPAGGTWRMDSAIAANLISAARDRQIDYVIDYEHQSLKPGAIAPAAGWFKQLVWREDGLYTTDARWTAQASRMIREKEYRFISPTFIYDQVTGAVLSLHNISLTNNPALRTLTDLAKLSLEGIVIPAASSGMSAQDRANFTWVFGIAPEALDANNRAEQSALSSRLAERDPAITMNEKDRATYFHVFGMTPEEAARGANHG